jgi:2-dehydro-3-deoxyphosphogluconate aldolase/(4S)-4-hydroxy-2-oxoglutarate aldolase
MADTQILFRTRVIPVVRAGSADDALRLARLLVTAGFDAIELTMTVPCAVDVLKQLSRQLITGMGTVLSADEAEAAMAAGAAFIVTPCLVEGVAERCRSRGVPALIGALSPSEIWRAHQSGAAAVKVFPVSSLGGPHYVRHVRSVFPSVHLVPTGGVREDQIRDYLGAGALAVGMGGDLLAGGDQEIIDRARRVLAAARG